VLDFAQRLVQQGALTAVRLANIPLHEARDAAEMMLIGSSIKVAPVVQWDGQKIGGGKPGTITKKLLEMWNEDARSAQDQLIAVPYDQEV
jgi:D-alanine transaminase